MNDLSVTLDGVARDDESFRAESGGKGSQLWGQLEKCLRQREQQRWTSRGGRVLDVWKGARLPVWREQCEDDGVRKPGGGVRGLPSPAQWSPTSHAQDVHQPIVKQPLLKIKLN